jgi:hypothetical protein
VKARLIYLRGTVQDIQIDAGALGQGLARKRCARMRGFVPIDPP